MGEPELASTTKITNTSAPNNTTCIIKLTEDQNSAVLALFLHLDILGFYHFTEGQSILESENAISHSLVSYPYLVGFIHDSQLSGWFREENQFILESFQFILKPLSYFRTEY